MKSDLLSRTPALRAELTPPFSFLTNLMVRPYLATTSCVLSDEPSSTTMISFGRRFWARTLSIARSSTWARLYVGMTAASDHGSCVLNSTLTRLTVRGRAHQRGAAYRTEYPGHVALRLERLGRGAVVVWPERMSSHSGKPRPRPTTRPDQATRDVPSRAAGDRARGRQYDAAVCRSSQPTVRPVRPMKPFT